jgi:hypothetical protein
MQRNCFEAFTAQKRKMGQLGMLPSALLCLLITALPSTEASCNADNCLRAIRGTSIPGRVEEGLADCSSYLLATVTPANL